LNNSGLILIVSGPSGVGKGTICSRLVDKYPDEYVLSISATSRKPRGMEVDGREYFFKTKEEFEQMISDGMFLEYAQYVGNYYGTPLAWVKDKLDKDINVILEIDVQGGLQVKKKYPDAVTIFVVPPDKEELIKRLGGRGTENSKQIENRIKRASEEMKFAESYDYVIINEIVENSVDLLHNITLSIKEKLSKEA
jgi:guanylate kinase